MAEGGFDPNDPNSFEVNEDIVLPDDDSSEDFSHIDVNQNNPEFSPPAGSRQETSFITLKGSPAPRWIVSYRDSFKSKYGIDNNTFDTLRLNLNQRDGNLYYKNVQINRKDGKGLYSVNSIKGTGAGEFRNIIESHLTFITHVFTYLFILMIWQRS